MEALQSKDSNLAALYIYVEAYHANCGQYCFTMNIDKECRSK